MHNIIFAGELMPGYEQASVRTALGNLFRISDPAKLDVLFSGKSVTLKKNLDAEQARRYEQALQKAGARCRIEPPLLSLVMDEAPAREEPVAATDNSDVNFNTIAAMPTDHLQQQATANPYAASATVQAASGPGTQLPDAARGVCWGGFLLTPIWGLFNGTYIALLSLVPYIGILVSIWMLVKGRELAWRNKHWNDVDHFNRVQRRWSIAGVIVLVVSLLMLTMAIVTVVNTASQMATATNDSSDAEFEQQLEQIEDPEMRQALSDLREALKQAEQESQYYDERDGNGN